jgi:ribosomal RNA-processing protein 12
VVHAVCQQVLPGPEAAARAAAAASSQKRSKAEAAITKAVADALKLLGWLKSIVPFLTGVYALLMCHANPISHAHLLDANSDSLLRLVRYLTSYAGQLLTQQRSQCAGKVLQEVVGLILKLYVLHQPLLSRSATECLAAVCSRSSSLSSAVLVDLLKAVIVMESAWNTKDPAILVSLIELVQAGYMRCVLRAIIVMSKFSIKQYHTGRLATVEIQGSVELQSLLM